MDKITFEEYCKYAERGINVVPVIRPLKDKDATTILCKSELEKERLCVRLCVFRDSYIAIKDHPNEKDRVLKALQRYERTGKPFVIGYNYWESSEEPPEDFKFININWGDD